MEPDLNKLNSYSGVNYMKRSDTSGQSTINTADLPISHNLNYTPQFVIYADLDGDGFLWYGGEKVFEGTNSTSFFASPPPLVDSWITDTTLTMHPYNFSAARAIHWLIYLDYGA